MNEKSFENNNSVEKENILTLEQKKILADAWVNLVVDCEKTPENLEELEQEELKEWMFQALMHDVKRLLAEWEIESDELKTRNIVLEIDIEKKSQLEKEYILEMHKKVRNKVQNFPKRESRRWNSWPKTMRELGSFNCVGASMLGIEILENAGIQSYYGNPVGHVINIAKLSNGDWWYVDFLNDDSQCKKINPREIMITGMKVLEIHEDDIDYSLIPIDNDSEITESIINNLITMSYEVTDDTIDDDNKGKIFAKKYLEENKNIFPTIENLESIHTLMFPKKNKLLESSELAKEREHIRKLHKKSSSSEYFHSLTEIEEKEVIDSLCTNISLIEKLFRYGEEDFYDVATKQSSKFIRFLHEEMEEKRKENENKYNLMVDRILEKIKKLKK